MMQLLVSEILRVTEGHLVCGSHSLPVTSISTDSRTIQNGDMFIALKGPNFDGARFADIAFKSGAAGIMAANLPPGFELPSASFYIKVDNAEKAMGDVAGYLRKCINPKVLSVTGSSGKTTTKDLLYHCVKNDFNTVCTQGNFNNTIGVPITVFRIEADTDLLILELGINMPGEMSRLGKIADPDVIILTNIGLAHIGMFDSQEALIKAKAEILDFAKSDCVLVLNSDCKNAPAFLSHARYNHRIVWFGIDSKADIRADNIRATSPLGYEFDLHLRDTVIRDVKLPLYGKYNIYNALGAAAGLLAVGMTPEKIVKGFSDFFAPKMRSEVFQRKGITIISDCYNANPDSVKVALESMEDLGSDGKKYVLLGDMLELADSAEKLHRETGAFLADLNVDLLLSYGDLSKFTAEAAGKKGKKTIHCNTHREAADILLKKLMPGDIVLIKGSRLMALEKVTQLILDSLSSENG
jgi:UDP-N-acetylmuramoyl-tripeptide--D-alanyl-D-alanine ligase